MKKLGIFVGLLCVLVQVQVVKATVYTVNVNTDALPFGGGVGAGTTGDIRWCFGQVNANAATGPHSIVFNIAAAVPITITLGNPLPVLANVVGGVTVNGFTQPGFTANPVIFLDGPGYGEGIALNNCDNSIIQGLGLVDFGNNGVMYVYGGSDNVTIRGVWIGLNTLGTAVLGGNNSAGINITNSSYASIGGDLTTDPTYKVVITNRQNGIYLDNAKFNTIRGTFIGTNVAGTAAVGTISNVGIFMLNASIYNTVGGTSAGERCVISNGNTGVRMEGATTRHNRLYNNRIGTDINGTVDLGNSVNGVRLVNANSNNIGGKLANQGNIISGNNDVGIMFETDGDSNLVARNYVGLASDGSTLLLNGTAANHHGINVQGGGCAFNRFFNNVIVTINRGSGLYYDGAGGDTLDNNYFGTDATGLVMLGLGSTTTETGILVNSGGAAPNMRFTNNVVAGSKGNGIEIRGGSKNNLVFLGNKIGMNVNGMGTTFGNTWSGLYIHPGASTNLTIGGTNVSDRNIVSMNGKGTPTPACAGTNGCGIIIENVNGVTIQGNYIGTDATGLAARGNGSTGIQLNGGNTNVLIGGIVAGARNLICDNGFNCSGPPANVRHGIQFVSNTGATNMLVQGNYIGIGVDGTTLLGNSEEGVSSWQTNNIIIGGNTAAHRNVIAGSRKGVFFQPGVTGCMVLGNYIGTDATGTLARPNIIGVHLSNGANGIYVGRNNAGEGNVISGNRVGIQIDGNPTPSGSNFIYNNIVGLQSNGNTVLPNDSGMYIRHGSANNTIGTSGANGPNVFSGNTRFGLMLDNADNNIIQANFIGVSSGYSNRPNGFDGIRLSNGSFNNTIGSPSNTALGNVIAFNTNNGINITDAGSSRNNIRRNSIYCNGSARVNGINLNGVGNTNIDIDPLIQVAPYISAPTPGITGTFTNQAPLAGTDVIEVFYDDGCGTCQGRTYLGVATSLNSPAAGDWTFSPLPAGADCSPKGVAGCLSGVKNITATRTDANGNTSEFMDCDPLPLPVSLVHFTGEAVSSTDILLQWQTAKEENNAHFEIFRSTDMQSFVFVARIDGAGNSATLKNYQHQDKGLISGLYYYMLVQTDIDGTQSVSKIISVRLSGGENAKSVFLLGNTSDGHGTLVFQNFTGEKLTVALYDMQGRIVAEYKGTEAMNQAWKMEGLAIGTYLVKMNTTLESKTEKLIIK